MGILERERDRILALAIDCEKDGRTLDREYKSKMKEAVGFARRSYVAEMNEAISYGSTLNFLSERILNEAAVYKETFIRLDRSIKDFYIMRDKYPEWYQ